MSLSMDSAMPTLTEPCLPQPPATTDDNDYSTPSSVAMIHCLLRNFPCKSSLVEYREDENQQFNVLNIPPPHEQGSYRVAGAIHAIDPKRGSPRFRVAVNFSHSS